MKGQILLLVFNLVMVLSSIGQHQISGTIRSGETSEPLPGANVRLSEGFLATVSAGDGTFTLGDLKPGNYTLVVSYIGFETFEKDLELVEDVQFNIRLTPKSYVGEEVIISAIRAGGSSPTSYRTVTAEQIERENTGKDMPYLMESLPSVVVNSDAGNGVGYTSMTIRGTDLTRINVTLNGVPVNDAESQGVFFVDLPDLVASAEDIRVQRGVGYSTNGAASFGASININTGKFRQTPYGEYSSAAGSFNTFRNSLSMGTGLMNGKWTIDGRLSWITSNGYVDRASSDLKSIYLAGGYSGKKDVVKIIGMSGIEKTYQAWYGTPKDSLATNRTYNPAGEILDDEGNIIGYYDNQTDNYRQTYLQLHWGHEFTRHLNLAATAFYTRGIGYYENYRNDRSFAEYGLADTVIGNDTVGRADMIDQKWLDNHFYGLNLSMGYSSGRWTFHFGTSFSQYVGDHYGYVIWSQVARLGEYDDPWYDNTGRKNDFNLFGKANYRINEQLDLFLDLQYRHVSYSIEGTHDDLRDLTQDHQFNFFNPKLGIGYSLNNRNEVSLYGGISNREPNRSVYRDADPGQEVRAERLYDLEAGYAYRSKSVSLELNAYYMYYRDQLVLTGKINNVGAAIMTNVPRSYRAGIEVIGGVRFLKIMEWQMNATFSRNKILDYVNYTDNWDTWPDQVVDTLGTTNISFSPDIVASSRLSVEPLTDFTISLVSKYVGRQYIDNTSTKSASIDPYYVHRLEFFYSLKSKRLRKIDFWLHLNNLFNSRYETYAWVYRYVYESDEYELNGYFPQAGFNFMVGINLKF